MKGHKLSKKFSALGSSYLFIMVYQFKYKSKYNL